MNEVIVKRPEQCTDGNTMYMISFIVYITDPK